jgi:hypothetical protein
MGPGDRPGDIAGGALALTGRYPFVADAPVRVHLSGGGFCFKFVRTAGTSCGEPMEGTPRTRRRRSADASTAELLRAVAGERIAIGDGEPRRRMSQREALAHLLWDMALRGDLTACRLILEYMEGKPLQRIAAAVSSGEPPKVTADELGEVTNDLLEWIEARKNADPPQPDSETGDREPGAGS